MNKRILFLSFGLVLVLATIAVVILRQKSKPVPQVTTTPQTSENFEIWRLNISGERRHSSCNGKFQISGELKFIFQQSLSSLLKRSPEDPPVEILASGAGHIFELSDNLESSEQKVAKISARFYWLKGPQLKILIESNEPLLLGGCKNQTNLIQDPVRSIELTSNQFLANSIQGIWNYGQFELKWISGGTSNIPIQGPSELKALASSGNVTVSWEHFPGVEFYRTYVRKTDATDKGAVIATKDSSTNFAVITELIDGTAYSFTTSVVVGGIEFISNQAVIARPGLPITATKIVAGDNHACALLTNKKVACWGANEHGQVGDGSMTTFSLPVIVPDLSLVKTLKASGNQTCARLESGHEKCWGQNVPSSLTKGENFLCVETKEHRIKCQGDNSVGQLASGDQIPRKKLFEPSYFTSESIEPGTLVTGLQFACVITKTQNVICWGANHVGQIGNGSGGFSSIPQPVNL